MKNISTLVAALLLTGILGISATFVSADSNEPYPFGTDQELSEE